MDTSSLYPSVNLTVGLMGFPFKEAGPYIIEASFWNVDRTAAAAIAQVWIRPPHNFDDYKTFAEIYTPPMARAIYFGGSRVIEAVNERLDWVMQKLGPSHPATKFLAITRFGPLTREYKVVLPRAPRFKVFDPEPELALKKLQPIVDEPEATANVFGNIGYHRLVDLCTSAALLAGQKPLAQSLQKRLKRFFEGRKVLPQILDRIDQYIKELK